MKFGVCCSVEQAPLAIVAGADFVEVAAWPLAADSEYRKRLADLPVEAVNLFCPPNFGLFEDRDIAQRHGETVLLEAGRLGIKVAVVGSGAARRAPAGMAPEEAEREFVLTMVHLRHAEAASGVRLAPESLNRQETDVGNDLGRLAAALREHGVAYTADAYHVLVEWDLDGRRKELDELWREQVPFAPAHVHLAALDRSPPTADDPMLQGFVSRLRDVGYEGRMSLECRWDDFEKEVGPSLGQARALWS